MIKENTYIKTTISLLLSLSTIAVAAQANDINKLDIKRTNSNGTALNLTVYTTNPYDENVAVTQKGDNKYVILIPNISGTSASNVDFSSLKDIVSDVNVKSVNDGAGGYTKVTLTTTKPVSISTSTRKSTPLTEEQKAYKNLIAQSRGYNVQTPKTDNVSPKATIETINTSLKEKKENTAPIISKTPIAENNIKSQEPIKVANTNEVQSKSKSIADKLKGIVEPSETSQSNKTETTTNSEKVVDLPVLDTSYKKDSGRIKDTLLQDLKNDIIAEKGQSVQKTAVNTTPIVSAENNSSAEHVENIQNDTNSKGLNTTMITTILLLLASLLGITALFRMVKKSLEHSTALKRSFKENLKEKPHPRVIDYSDIVGDTSLNWQEKYQKFMSTIEVINPDDGLIRQVGDGEYEYVNPQDNIAGDISSDISTIGNADTNTLTPKLTSYNKPAINSTPNINPIRKGKTQDLINSVEPKNADTKAKENFAKIVSNLERTLKNSPSHERPVQTVKEDIIKKQFEDNMVSTGTNNVPIYKEDDVIPAVIKSSPKLKTFDNNTALEKTRRKEILPKRASDIIRTKNIESKHVNLEKSSLYTSSREFQNANLNSSDLISGRTIGKDITLPKVSVSQVKGTSSYSMATVEEFFDIKTPSHASVPSNLSCNVAETLENIGKPKAKVESVKNSGEVRLPNGNLVISGYKINNNSGFYIVSDDEDKCSLIGIVNNTTTVLKEFGTSVKYKLQVRKDSPNVYMVRVGGERFLVEVSGNNMGVLIAL